MLEIWNFVEWAASDISFPKLVSGAVTGLLGGLVLWLTKKTASSPSLRLKLDQSRHSFMRGLRIKFAMREIRELAFLHPTLSISTRLDGHADNFRRAGAQALLAAVSAFNGVQFLDWAIALIRLNKAELSVSSYLLAGVATFWFFMGALNALRAVLRLYPHPVRLTIQDAVRRDARLTEILDGLGLAREKEPATETGGEPGSRPAQP